MRKRVVDEAAATIKAESTCFAPRLRAAARLGVRSFGSGAASSGAAVDGGLSGGAGDVEGFAAETALLPSFVLGGGASRRRPLVVVGASAPFTCAEGSAGLVVVTAARCVPSSERFAATAMWRGVWLAREWCFGAVAGIVGPA
jgi:hypothetical protein